MTTFKIGQTVARLNPDKTETIHQIKTDAEVKYHQDLQARGYTYTVIDGEKDELDFDLPEVKGDLRIHRKPFEECESCSA